MLYNVEPKLIVLRIILDLLSSLVSKMRVRGDG